MILGLVATTACGDVLEPARLGPEDLSRAEVSGGGQVGTVDEPLAEPVTVRLTTRKGAGAGDVTLEWRALDGSGRGRFPTTRTNAEGRSTNQWVLGRRSGAQALEIRAVLPDGAVAVDTVLATAEPGPVASLVIEGDTARTLVLGDTFRVALRAADLFGNPVPTGEAAVRWSSTDPAVAAVDSTGKVRAAGFGAATLEARAGTESVRVRLRVSARAEVVPIALPGAVQPMLFDVVGNGGRMAAIAWDGAAGRSYLLSRAGAAWNVQEVPARPNSLHVTSAGLALAGTENGPVYLSDRDGLWNPFPPLPSLSLVTGVGDRVFARRDNSSIHVYRLDDTGLVDLLLPSRYQRTPFRLFAAESSTDVYAAVDSLYRTVLMHWDGSEWNRVLTPGDTTPLGIFRLRGEPRGGPVWGWSGNDESLLYRIRGGVAEPVALPPGVRAGFNTPVAVSPDGQPYVLLTDRIVYRTASGWKTMPVPGDWSATAIWPEAEGVAWVGARRPSGMSGSLVAWEVAFLRITAVQ